MKNTNKKIRDIFTELPPEKQKEIYKKTSTILTMLTIIRQTENAYDFDKTNPSEWISASKLLSCLK